MSSLKHVINGNSVNESLPIHLGNYKTKAYTIYGTRTVYIFRLRPQLKQQLLVASSYASGQFTINPDNLVSFEAIVVYFGKHLGAVPVVKINNKQ